MGYLPRKKLKQTVYHPVPLETKEVAIQRLVLLVPVEEQQNNEQAAQQDHAYTNLCQELSPDEQPRAWTSAPTRSLSPTTRPAGAGWLYRAGPSQRLVAITSVLCLTPPFLCETPELDMDYNKELPENVVVPLSNSGPLSVLKPSTLSLYEVTSRALSLSEMKPSVHSL